MDENDEYSVLDAIRDLTESDRAFFGIVRFLDGNTRNHIVAAQMRNTNTAYQLLRMFITNPPHRETMVMNVPLSELLDPSGNLMRNFMEPVPIVPTPSQVLSGTEIVTVAPPDTQCSICQEDVTSVHTRIHHCGHRFHQLCIRQWFEVNPRCPVCRHDIRERRERRDLHSSASSTNNDNSMYPDEE